jgi:hypothetical protein
MNQTYEEMSVEELISARADLERIKSNTHYPEMIETYNEKINEIANIIRRKRSENPVVTTPKKKRNH